MKYYKMQEAKIQKMYGSSSHYSNMGQTLTIVQSGNNRGEKGTPNLDLVLPFPGIPMTKSGEYYDIRKGFAFSSLLKSYFSEIEDGSTIIPLARIKNHPVRTEKKQLYVTFDSTKVDFVLIKRKCDQNTAQLTREELRELSDIARPGAPKGDSTIYWDYYVIPFKSNYNYVFGRDDCLVSAAKFAANPEQVKHRRQLLKSGLEELFGSLNIFVCLESVVSKQNSRKHKTEKDDVDGPAVKTDQLSAWHYQDEMYHDETWVVCGDGRYLNPDSSTNHGLDEKRYAGEKISVDESWQQIPEDALVVQYIRRSFSEPAIYAFLQRPAIITAAHLDRLAMLENLLMYETRSVIMKYRLFDRLALRGQERPWTLQLHDEEVLARAATRQS